MRTIMEIVDAIADGIAGTLFCMVLVNSVASFIVSYIALTRSRLPNNEIREGLRFIVCHHAVLLSLVILLVTSFTLSPPEFMPPVIPSICAIAALYLANKIARSFDDRISETIALQMSIAQFKTLS